MSGQAVAFFALAAVGLLGVIGFLRAPRILHAVLALVAAFLAVAGLFVLVGAEFLAAATVLLYAGAITVMAVFAIMLTPGGEEKRGAPRWARGARGWAGLVAAGVGAAVATSVLATPFQRSPYAADGPTDTALLGTLLLSDRYGLHFEVITLVLLAALVGAIVLAREEAIPVRGGARAPDATPPTPPPAPQKTPAALREPTADGPAPEAPAEREAERELVGAGRGDGR
ncbi:MAG: NADH-quinone oxidoreductase subunit J [Hydrogenibacillus schlegelii]|uniref:NADH-quinone oxidoreductase subunit J n=1 Tax=Hydrogenibacillus schlegelii TaxID=1484 RepID=A0A947CW98_HYDSH|nr:NADH-quinone oxidoreductase subunit J [Hydrogenibacillus schlegelii]